MPVSEGAKAARGRVDVSMQAFGRSTGAVGGGEAQTERLSLCPNRVLSAPCPAWHHFELLFVCLSELPSALRDRPGARASKYAQQPHHSHAALYDAGQ